MAPRTTTVAAACTVAAAALLLSACGGGGDDAKIQPTSSQSAPATTSASSAPTSAATPASAAPTFDFPPDVKVVVDADTTGDPVKDAVLRDQGYGQKAIFLAIAKLDSNLPVFKKYLRETAEEDWTSKIGWGKSNHETVTGTTLFYDRKVTLNGANTAGVTFCESERDSYGKNSQTGKVIKTTPSIDDFTYHSALMRKAADGTWQMATYKSQDHAAKCQR